MKNRHSMVKNRFLVEMVRKKHKYVNDRDNILPKKALDNG